MSIAKRILIAIAALLYLGSVATPCAIADIDLGSASTSEQSQQAPKWKADCPCHKSGAPPLQNVGSDWQGPPSERTAPLAKEVPRYRVALCTPPASRVTPPPKRIPII